MGNKKINRKHFTASLKIYFSDFLQQYNFIRDTKKLKKFGDSSRDEACL